MIIGILILFSSSVLAFIPFSIGPVTVTMLLELAVVVVLIGHLIRGFRVLDKRAKMFIFVCVCMFVLSWFHLDSVRARERLQYIFGSVYTYTLITCIFRGPGAMPWVRRVHLIPAYSALAAFIWLLVMGGGPELGERIGGNDLPVYLAVLLPISWAQRRNEVGPWRVLNGMVIPLACGVEVLSASRGGAVCLLLALILMLLMGRRGGMKWLPPVFAVSVLSIVFAHGDVAFTERVTGMITSPAESLQERMMLWSAAALFTWDHPFLGGDFSTNVGDYTSRATWGSDAPMRYQRGELYVAAGEHNGYLAVTASFGVIVAAFYFAYFIGLGRRLRQAIRTIPDSRSRIYLSAGLSALLVWAVAMIGLHIYLGWEYLLIWGVMECALASARDEEAARGASVSAWNHGHNRGNYSPRIGRPA